MSSLYSLLRRRPSLVAVSLLVAGCGSNPARPGASQPPVVVQPPIVITSETNLPAGSYRLTLLSSPSAGDCTRELPSVPLAGAIVEIDVRLTHTEGGSVVRSATAADGELELQYGALRPDRSAAGWLRGVGQDVRNKAIPPSAGHRHITVTGSDTGQPATTDVRVALTIQTAVGTLAGMAIFHNTPAGAISCRSALWSLRPPATF
jgi:hypothetical protein